MPGVWGYRCKEGGGPGPLRTCSAPQSGYNLRRRKLTTGNLPLALPRSVCAHCHTRAPPKCSRISVLTSALPFYSGKTKGNQGLVPTDKLERTKPTGKSNVKLRKDSGNMQGRLRITRIFINSKTTFLKIQV